MPNINMQARASPPAAYIFVPGFRGIASVAEVGAVVETVSVAVPEVVPVILIGVVEPKLNVGAFWTPVGLEVIAAVRAMLPVKPPLGVAVMEEVFPVVAPALSVTAEPVIAKLGATGAVTTTELVPVAGL
jgi:hypothetical protein